MTRIVTALWLALLLACGAAARAALPITAPLAGSVIENVARATYFDTDLGFNTTIVSNPVRVTVQPREALTLTSDNAVPRPAGGVVALPHRLTNTGNAPSRYLLAFGNRSDDDFDLQVLSLVWDRNGNGVADPGEPLLADGATFGPLAPGESADLVLSATVPSGLAADRVGRLDLRARTLDQGLLAANIDSITVADGALLQVFQTASVLNPKPLDRVTLTLVASNTGNKPATGMAVSVDGAPMLLTLLRDVIPANTTLAALGAPGSALALYHLRGQADTAYTATPPADLRLVDAVAFGFAAAIVPGQSFTRSLEVTLNANASGSIETAAQLFFMDGVHPAPVSADSNLVRLVVPNLPPSIRLFNDAAYTRRATVISAGQPFFVAVDAAQCNLDPLRRETRAISITSQLSGDAETFVATETGSNTGVFHIEPSVPTRDARSTPVTAGDGALTVKPNDRLTVSMPGCGATLLRADVLVDPYGVVFDSKTSAAVAGAVVTLVDLTGAGNGGDAGGPARVFLADGVTRAPSSVTTHADGSYQFPLVAPSRYRLRVAPPTSYAFASTLAPNLLPPERSVDPLGSYGGEFTISELSEPVHLDIPVDASPRSGFFIEKTVSRRAVELGETLDYTVRLKNVSGQLLGRIALTDHLPAGFAYQRGSVRLDGGVKRLDRSVLPEPEGGVGPVLVFNLGSIEDQAVITLTYRVRVGPGALQGSGINRAQATTAGPLAKLSNEASVAVQVLPGVFTDRGYLVGNVYADCNADGERTAGEPGIPGVRLFLEDGTNVTTDAQGRYSLYGLRAQTHVLKLDRTTLPAGAGPLAVLANRNAGDAGSRFVDMKNGDLHKGDFAVTGCTPALMEAIAARVGTLALSDAQGEGAQAAQLAADTRVLAPIDPRSLPASGIVGVMPAGTAALAAAAAARAPAGRGAASLVPAALGTTPLAPAGTDRPTAPSTPAEAAFTDAQIAAFDNALAILTPADAQVLGYAQTTVTIKGALDATLALRVNGVEQPASRIGKVSRLESRQLQVVEYIGVDLKAGTNRFEATQADAFGNPRGSVSTSAVAPGALARLRLTGPAAAPVADGRSAVRVVLETLDAAGVTVTTPTAVTLDASAGRWRLRDLNPAEPGLQIFVEGGRVELELEAPSEPGDAQLSAQAGSITTQVTLGFVPELRPLIAAGIVEGVLSLRHLDSKALQPVRAQDGFEQELRALSGNFDNGRGNAAARAAMYLKGKVLGETLLTLAYDSDKDTRERLFRDIQPGEYYPVYGDSSVKGFDAQSTGRAYVRLDNGKSNLLYGDFNTQVTVPAVNANGSSAALAVGDERRLGQYSRSLTGVKTHLESDDGRAVLTAFASRASSRQVVDEVPARGISGPYALSRAAPLENSEKVEILTRDRNQLGSVLKTQPLARFADYEIERLTGSILLKAPLPSLDDRFNPNSLRITYEVDAGGAAFWVGGVDARVQLNAELGVGVAVVRDTDPQNPRTLANAGATVRLGERTTAVAEFAQTETPLAEHGRGNAARLEFKHDDARLQAQARWQRAGIGFDNPTSGVSAGRDEALAKATYKVAEGTTLVAEALRSREAASGAEQFGAQVGIEQALSDTVRVEVGVRHSRGNGIADTLAAPLAPSVPALSASSAGAAEIAPRTGTSVRVKLIAQVPALPQASVFGEYEQDIEDATRRVAAVGGEYRLGQGSRVYARHELIASLGNRYTVSDTQQRNASVLGIQTDTVTNGTLFSEYRLRDALDGREAEAAIGLRNRWALGGGLSASTGYERVRSLRGHGTGSGESTAVTGGLEYTGARDWKGAARLELRNSTSSDSVLSTVGIAYKLSDQWTALGKNLLAITTNRAASDKRDDWLQFGLAYRESDANRVNSLLRAEFRHESVADHNASGAGPAPAAVAGATPDSNRNVAIVSAHLNLQPSARLLLSGRIAAKWAAENSLGIVSHTNTQLIGARATYDLAREWDIGLQAGVLMSGDARARQWGLGAEVGRVVAENLWLSVGWNLFGFTDRDLTAQDYTNPGVYLRLRWKFDEALFKRAAE